MCLHVLFSFQRTGLAFRSLGAQRGIQATAYPSLVRGPKTGVDRVQGNLPTLLPPLRAVNIFFSSPAVFAHERKAAAGIGCWKPSVVVSDLGAREAGNLGTAAVSERRTAINERRRRNSILRAGGGLVNPDYHCSRAISLSPVALNPGARHVTTASHTAGQPPREYPSITAVTAARQPPATSCTACRETWSRTGRSPGRRRCLMSLTFVPLRRTPPC